MVAYSFHNINFNNIIGKSNSGCHNRVIEAVAVYTSWYIPLGSLVEWTVLEQPFSLFWDPLCLCGISVDGNYIYTVKVTPTSNSLVT